MTATPLKPHDHSSVQVVCKVVVKPVEGLFQVRKRNTTDTSVIAHHKSCCATFQNFFFVKQKNNC